MKILILRILNNIAGQGGCRHHWQKFYHNQRCALLKLKECTFKIFLTVSPKMLP